MRTFKPNGLWSTCSNRMVHMLEKNEVYPKKYKKYFNDPYSFTCNCKERNGKKTERENNEYNGSPYKAGGICEYCKGKYKPLKRWNYQCSECNPKEGK